MKFQTILAGFIAQRGAAANGAVKLRPKQPEPAVFTESYPIVVTSSHQTSNLSVYRPMYWFFWFKF